jgi:hypothetical protein
MSVSARTTVAANRQGLDPMIRRTWAPLSEESLRQELYISEMIKVTHMMATTLHLRSNRSEEGLDPMAEKRHWILPLRFALTVVGHKGMAEEVCDRGRGLWCRKIRRIPSPLKERGRPALYSEFPTCFRADDRHCRRGSRGGKRQVRRGMHAGGNA